MRKEAFLSEPERREFQLGLDLVPISQEQVEEAERQIAEQSKRIEFLLTEYSVELLAAKMESGDFEIPTYQREDTWEPERKSRFIESLLMGLPIPFLFFWERPDGKLEIVDGSQRLRTIHQFILGGLVLGEVDVLTALEGMRFRELPTSRQRKINNRSIRGIILNEHADEQARFEIFDRINTGSKIANNAEVRRGALIGPFLDLVIELTENATFKRLAPVPEKTVKLREREELVTRFFAYGDGLDGYRDRPSDFLFAYARSMNVRFREYPEEVQAYRDRFKQTMDFVARVFPYGFRRSESGTATPRTRFEAIAIGSYFAIRERPAILNEVPEVTSWLTSEEFGRVIGSDGANAIARLRARVEFVRDRLLAS
jgi:hypothetical protein